MSAASSLLRRALPPLINVHNLAEWPAAMLDDLLANCTVKADFITPDEEANLLKEIEPHMKRLKYEKAHWDDAIYLYREREQRRWKPENEGVLHRIRDISFPLAAHHLSYVHILDLHKDGYIRPHIDSTRYCGDVITGVSLLSDAVMRLRHKDDKDNLVMDLLIKQRSLYKLTGIGRYDFTHEVLGKEASVFKDELVPRSRRIAVICRDLPQHPDENQPPDKLEYQSLD